MLQINHVVRDLPIPSDRANSGVVHVSGSDGLDAQQVCAYNPNPPPPIPEWYAEITPTQRELPIT